MKTKQSPNHARVHGVKMALPREFGEMSLTRNCQNFIAEMVSWARGWRNIVWGRCRIPHALF